MVATSIGVVVRETGFAFRPDASQVNHLSGRREVSVLYEAEPEEVADRLQLSDGGRGSCVDLWIYWSPDTGQLDVSLPGRLWSPPLQAVDRDGLRVALEAHARALAEQLTSDD